jgi:glycosyltransferase involved in cell wall biosynthesis
MTIGVVRTDDLPSTSIGLRISEMKRLGFSKIVLYAKTRISVAKQFSECVVATSEKQLADEIASDEDPTVIVDSRCTIDSDCVKALGIPSENEIRCLVGDKLIEVKPVGTRSLAKVYEYDRRKNVARFASGDSGDIVVDTVDTRGPFSLRGSSFLAMLKYGDKFLRGGVDMQYGAESAGIRIVCSDPVLQGVKWHSIVNTYEKKPNSVVYGEFKYDKEKTDRQRNDEIVVSVSTYRARFHILEESIGSILNQTVAPWKVCVVVDSCDIPYLSDFLKRMQAAGSIEILTGSRDLGPHNKYVHAMSKYPNKAVITFDDDAVYRPNAIEELVSTYKRHPDCVVARRVHLMKYRPDGSALPYKQWVNQCTYVMEPSFDLCATGVGGVLYPPGLFTWSEYDKALMRRFKADDLFLKKRENDLGVRVVYTGTPKDADPRITRDGAQAFALLNTNVNGGNNDVEARALSLSVKTEETQDGPFFRVIIPVYNSTETLRRALESIKGQTFDDYAVCVCDDGSSAKFAKDNEALVASFGERGSFVHTYENRFAGSARNTAMESFRNARYTLFLDADDKFVYDSLFSDLYRFIHAKSFPDVVVLPFFDRSGKSTVPEISIVNSPQALARARITGVPWAKCIKTDKVQPFSEGLRRSNDVMQHYLTVDTAVTVVPFRREAVRYMQDSETTMFGPYGRRNRRSVHALSCYLKCVLELIQHDWRHDYTKSGVAVEVEHILKRMVPGLVSELGIEGIKGFFKSGVGNASV